MRIKLPKFSKDQHAGILILLILVLSLQGIIFYLNNHEKKASNFSKEELTWLNSQNEIDSLKLFRNSNSKKIYPFNPNFISDFKGYKLGLTTTQIDHLHKFRAQNKYVNSPAEFQKITGVSNQWLKKYAPYFKFPAWVIQKHNFSTTKAFKSYSKFSEKKIIIKDINLASQQDLEAVFMIGEKMAQRILLERDKFGAFGSMDQLNLIWGISPEAIEDLNKKFAILSKSGLKKIKINDFTIKELAQFPYFNYSIAKNIVTYRSMNGDFKNFEDLTKVKQFPVEKLKILALYLEF